MSPIAVPAARKHVTEVWATDIVPTLCDFIRIPNVSVAFDPGWSDAGHMARAVELVADWLRARPIDGAAVEGPGAPRRPPVGDGHRSGHRGGDRGPGRLLYRPV